MTPPAPPAGDEGFVFDDEALRRDNVLTTIVVASIVAIACALVFLGAMIVDRSGVLR